MIKHLPVGRFPLLLFSSIFLLQACKKINEATTLGGDLIPVIDNINTFETFLETGTNNRFFPDSTTLSFTQTVALGYLNDPKFGTSTADVYFNIAPSVNNVNPFYVRDSVQGIDSVVLSLALTSYYGDTNAIQTVRVFEIAQSSTFKDSTLYRYDGTTDFTTTGAELGSKTYALKDLNDPIKLIRKRDTITTSNVLRIPLSSSLGDRFKTFDTSAGALGGFRNDSIFYTLFKGLAVRTAASGNSFGYYNLRDAANSKLTVYFRVQKNGRIDTASTDFIHITNGQANLIRRTVTGSAYEANIAANNGQKIFIQATPGVRGSFGGIRIPGLDTFRNSIIHRAELVVSRIDEEPAVDRFFTPPSRLYLDRKRVANDSVFFFLKDVVDGSGNLNPSFGGTLAGDGKYRFNITRYVQDIITGRERNDSLRLFAPLQVSYRLAGTTTPFVIPGNAFAGAGRVVVGGGMHPNPALRTRLRIIYSKIR